MTELFISKNTVLNEDDCTKIRTTLTKASCFLTLPPPGQSTMSTVRHITVTTIEGKTKFTAPLAAYKTGHQASLALLLLDVSAAFEKHSRNSFSSLYLFPDGYMFAHWSNIILGKNFFGEDKGHHPLGDNIKIEHFGGSHHHQLRFLKGLKHVFDICPHLSSTPKFTFV